MASRLRKVRRQRGSRTHGWGQVTQHRRTGSQGGSGMAGLHKHKWSFTVKYAPDHFGSNKWQPPNRVEINRWLNLYQLESLAVNGSEIDLVTLGFDKLLGQGEVHSALKVRTVRASASAIEKIKAAGGTIEVLEVAVVKEKKAPPEKKGNDSSSEKKAKDAGSEKQKKGKDQRSGTSSEKKAKDVGTEKKGKEPRTGPASDASK
jgi:large subunit ribosomal protein L15